MTAFELRRSIGELSRLSFNDCVRHLKSAEEAARAYTPLRVAVLRSYTAEPIEPVLKLHLMLEGFNPVLWFGGYNQFVQEVLDPSSPLYEFRPDLVLLLTRIEELVPDFVDDFGSRTGPEWETCVMAKAREYAALAHRTERALASPVIVQNMTLLRRPSLGIFDVRRTDGQRRLIATFNHALAAALADTPSSFMWDFDSFVHTAGSENLLDAKLWYISKNPFQQAAYTAIAADLMRYVRSILGRVTKCVVVDLDNTLWGGVAGEDGLEGVRLGHTYPGNCYRDFQRELLKLTERGILLAINSKNNEEDALRIIDDHPDMVLRRRHFAAMRINWRDKASNLRELAGELNIGLDSFVFVDDNPVECELIHRECPECEVVLLPDKPYLLPSIPSGLPRVENIRLTDEDRRKTDMYRAQADRKAHEEQSGDLNDFLRTLDIEVRIQQATRFSIPRIAQLTQKTNQMNMTTRRYTEAEVEALAAADDSVVFSVASRDRFGDEGIVGVVIVKFVAGSAVVDTFLLSCRVIGRGIEQAMLSFIADIARIRSAHRLVAEFFPTAKNRPAVGFYERAGLQKSTDNEFVGDLRSWSMGAPSHLRVSLDESRAHSG